MRGAWPRTHAAATRATELGCAAQGSPRHRRCPVLHCARAWRSPPTHARSRVSNALGGFAARLQIRTKPLQPAAVSACARTAPGADQASRRLIRAAPALMPVLQFTRKMLCAKCLPCAWPFGRGGRGWYCEEKRRQLHQILAALPLIYDLFSLFQLIFLALSLALSLSPSRVHPHTHDGRWKRSSELLPGGG